MIVTLEGDEFFVSLEIIHQKACLSIKMPEVTYIYKIVVAPPSILKV
jgi:hypothetical protein